MLRLNVHTEETGRAGMVLLLVVVLGGICVGILASTRYVLCPAPSGTAVYKMDRITGKVWLLTGDQVKALEKRREDAVLAPQGGGTTAPEDGKKRMIRWIREAVDFDSIHKPMLAASPYDLDLMGWEVYRLDEGELVPCADALVREEVTDRWVVGYTVRITHPKKGKLECGWYWEVCPRDSLILAINGNPVLESRYGLEDRTDPDVFALLRPAASARSEIVAERKSGTELFPFVASKKRDNFHCRSCSWAKKIPANELLQFRTAEEAKASGRRPCSVCRPK